MCACFGRFTRSAITCKGVAYLLVTITAAQEEGQGANKTTQYTSMQAARACCTESTVWGTRPAMPEVLLENSDSFHLTTSTPQNLMLFKGVLPPYPKEKLPV